MKTTEMWVMRSRAMKVAQEMETARNEADFLTAQFSSLLTHHEATEALLLEVAQLESVPVAMRERILEMVGV